MDDHNLFFTGYQKKIKKMLKFEVISFIGRIFHQKSDYQKINIFKSDVDLI